MSYRSVAKLNLFLQITGQRPDGYHHLQTLFKRLDGLFDILDFKVNDSGDVDCVTHGAIISSSDNLVLRAALKLQQHTGCNLGCAITLHKNIPTGGGLGGGSSNAATTLIVLNDLWQLGLGQPELLSIGLSLGADVPFFVSQLPVAWATGVGEELQEMPNFPEIKGVLLCPQAHISTQALFNDSCLQKVAPLLTAHAFDAQQWFVSDTLYNNCFTELVLGRNTEVATAYEYLRQFGLARLTGTGAGVFVAFPAAFSIDLDAVLASAPCKGVVF